MLIYRKLEDDILKHWDSPQAIFILGSRRVGKTSLLFRLQERVSENRRFYFDIEDLRIREIFLTGIEEFIAYLRTKGADLSRRNYIFVDEIQYLDDFSNFIKLAVDHYSDSLKFVLSGSSAAQIKMKFKDSLVGRKFEYLLYPLTFREFLSFKGEEKLERLLPDDPFQPHDKGYRFYQKEFQRLFEDFMVFGGYPEVALTEDRTIKKEIIHAIVQSYILKDIRNLFTIDKITEFNHLIKLLALYSGNLLNTSSIANEVKLSRITLGNYLRILTDTFIIRMIAPFYGNRANELRKMSKVFMLDNGIRNYLVDNFSPSALRMDKGPLLENCVFTSLEKGKRIGDRINFWRTQDRKEVDFVLSRETKHYPIEVKSGKVRRKHLRLFMELYKVHTGYTVGLRPEVTSNGSIVHLLPWVI